MHRQQTFQILDDINFSYYSTHEFHNNPEIGHCVRGSDSFSTLHCNIRSLAKNFDSLHNMLKRLHYKFSVIGRTEIKFQLDQDPIVNCDLSGYKFISQPSFSNNGGAGFFVKNDLKYFIRDDLTDFKDECEALWIEIEGKGKQNVLCGVVYRHPNGSLSTFQDYLNLVLDKIRRQNKQCLIMGDLNLNLLKYEKHADTDDVINTLGASFFQLHILRPTRITDHTATLTDNIFFTSLEYFTLSGNLVHDIADHLANFLILNKFPCLNS